MYLHKESILGFYKPTFFSILFNSDNVLDEQKRIKEEFDGVFFHEYIHFLQDLFTTFGLVNISNLVKEYSIINQEIIHLDANSFSIPYESSNADLKFSKELLRNYWGTDEIENFDKDFEVTGIFHDPYERTVELSQLSLVRIDIIYRSDLERDSFYLGAVHFLENMASLLERRLTLLDVAPPFPYKVIEKVIRYLFSDGDRSDFNLIIFMEDALNTYNPAEYLFHFISFCEQKGFTFDENSLCEFRKRYKMRVLFETVNLEKLFYASAADARRGLNLMFNHEVLSRMREWAKIVFSNVIKMKRAGFRFSDLLAINGDKSLVVKKIAKIVRKLGTPLMMTSNYQLFLIAPREDLSNDMVFLLGLEAIIKVISGDLKCDLIPHCSHGPNGENITNELCLNTPWLRTNQMPRCLFAQLWIMWGFVQKDVEVN